MARRQSLDQIVRELKPHAITVQKELNAIGPYIGAAWLTMAGLEGAVEITNMSGVVDDIAFWSGLAAFNALVLYPVSQDGLKNTALASSFSAYRGLAKVGKKATSALKLNKANAWFSRQANRDPKRYETQAELDRKRNQVRNDPNKRNLRTGLLAGATALALIASPYLRQQSVNSGRRIADAASYVTEPVIDWAAYHLFGGTDVTLHNGCRMEESEVNTILRKRNSPLDAGDILKYSEQYDICPDVFLGFALFETGLGVASGPGKTGRNPGNVRQGNSSSAWYCSSTIPTKNIGKFCSFPSWERGTEAWFQLIDGAYVDQGRDTLETIMPKYAPSVENDTNGHLEKIRDFVEDQR